MSFDYNEDELVIADNEIDDDYEVDDEAPMYSLLNYLLGTAGHVIREMIAKKTHIGKRRHHSAGSVGRHSAGSVGRPIK